MPGPTSLDFLDPASGRAAGRFWQALTASIPENAAVSLSGGLDASVVLALAIRKGATQAWFLRDAASEPERPLAHAAATALGVHLHEVPATPHPDDFEEAVRLCGCEVYNARAISKVRFWKGIDADGPVLVGSGADAMFAEGPLHERLEAFVQGPWPLEQVGQKLGVDVRAPFTTPSVISAVQALPDKLRRNKQLLRELPVLPASIRDAPKVPRYAPPQGWWDLYASYLEDDPEADDLLARGRAADPDSATYAVVDRELMRRASRAILAD